MLLPLYLNASVLCHSCPLHRYFAISSTAVSSSGPSAITVTISPVSSPRLIIPMMLLALTRRPSDSRYTVLSCWLATYTSIATGLASSPLLN